MPYTVAAAVKAAKSQIGYRESGNNNAKYNKWLGRIPGYPHDGYGYPWCQSFQSWVADQAGAESADYPRTAGCLSAVAWFKKKKRYSATPKVGAQVFYGPGGGTHVELVVAVSSTHITTVGGNTSGSLDGQYYNGNGVYQKSVQRSSERIHGYGMPDYDDATAPKPSPPKPSTGPAPKWPGVYLTQPPMMQHPAVRTWQTQMRRRGWDIGVDGVYGPGSEEICRAFQKEKGLGVDGVVGPKTWAAAWTAPVT